MAREQVELVNSFFARLGAGDVPAAMELIHPENVLIEPDGLPYGGRYCGREGFLEMVGRAHKLFDIQITDRDIRLFGDDVAGLFEATFASRRTGRSVAVRLVELYRVTDGMISSIEVFMMDGKAIHELAADPA